MGAMLHEHRFNVVSLTISPAIVNANTTNEQTFTLTGVAVGDFVYVSKPTHQTGLGIVNVRVSAANTIAISFMNNTAGNITPTASQTHLVWWIRPEIAGQTIVTD